MTTEHDDSRYAPMKVPERCNRPLPQHSNNTASIVVKHHTPLTPPSRHAIGFILSTGHPCKCIHRTSYALQRGRGPASALASGLESPPGPGHLRRGPHLHAYAVPSRDHAPSPMQILVFRGGVVPPPEVSRRASLAAPGCSTAGREPQTQVLCGLDVGRSSLLSFATGAGAGLLAPAALMYENTPAAPNVSRQPRYWLADQPPSSPSSSDERKRRQTILTLPRMAVPTDESVRTD
mmetsp:Transcript_29703/g.76775  ORF Transcript_29703/g.76775 Transcript_29703/m.76775 type:complete len:235 (-) Transcript_29703:215-919(-)